MFCCLCPDDSPIDKPVKITLVDKAARLECGSFESFNIHTNFALLGNHKEKARLEAIELSLRPIKNTILKQYKGNISVHMRVNIAPIDIFVCDDKVALEWVDLLDRHVKVYTPSLHVLDSRIITVLSSHYRSFVQQFGSICFRRVFFDDALNLKLPNCEKICAIFYWLLTYKRDINDLDIGSTGELSMMLHSACSDYRIRSLLNLFDKS